ncbi:pyridoxamine 5'-phosphate oxidase family protein [Halobacillus sp. B29]|uniref:pyridoxamine 5'-phosphate oxidase family protein n=1 Tax=Halobacillus sp. B29 TaxID=3457432 RepID=UPI003FCE7C05
MKSEPPFKHLVHSIAELREVAGDPSELANNKVISYLDQSCVEFIKHSPFLVLSTVNQIGNCDASPRGDQPGFVHVLDSTRLIIPERKGNKHLDSIQNILTQPSIGLLFMVPGTGETLRVNGTAYITRDPEYLEKMTVQGKTPLLGIGVEVKECFLHCAKAFKRSKLWEPEHWPETGHLPSAAKMMAAHANMPGVTEESVEKNLKESYKKRLY